MKRILTFAAIMLAFTTACGAEDRPISINQLPETSQNFIHMYYPEDTVVYAVKDDDLIGAGYKVRLRSGVEIEFTGKGILDNIEDPNGITESIIPGKIVKYVKSNFPDTYFIEYDVDKKSYEVKLSNRVEIKFNKDFLVISYDD